MQQQVKEVLRMPKWAVLGASASPEKFGSRILRVLRRHGYEVYAVNPRETDIDGQPCYPSQSAMPTVPHVGDMGVPPAGAIAALAECKQIGVRNVWLQPGVNTPETVAKAQELGLNVLFGVCAMVESSKLAALKRRNWVVAGAEELAAKLRQNGYQPTVVAGPEALLAGEEVLLMDGRADQTEAFIRAAAAKGFSLIWLQPGSETEKTIELALSQGVIVIHHADVLEEMEDYVREQATAGN